MAILALGSMVEGALSAATALQEEGISTMVVNARFAKPLDRDLIRKAARTTGCLLTLEENVLAGGFGSQVSQVLEEDNLDDCRLAKLGVPDTFIKHGARDRLLEEVGLSDLGIAKIATAVGTPNQIAMTGTAMIGAPAPVAPFRMPPRIRPSAASMAPKRSACSKEKKSGKSYFPNGPRALSFGLPCGLEWLA